MPSIHLEDLDHAGRSATPRPVPGARPRNTHRARSSFKRCHRVVFFAVFVGSLIGSSACSHPAPTSEESSEEPLATFKPGDATQTICADGKESLCSQLPTDMNNAPVGFGYNPDTNAGGKDDGFNQTHIDYFGWQAFIALNWPTDANGQPSTTETLMTDVTSPRVWSTYSTPRDIFGSSLATELAEGCGDTKGLLLMRDSKFHLSSFTEASPKAPLIDRYGNFVLYDVRVNDAEVKYLQKNKLTTKKGQGAFDGVYKFPAGSGSTVGSIEIKTSWRIMTHADSENSYYTVPAQIFIPAAQSVTGEPLCIEETVGLVGMHIKQKFTHPKEFSPFWSWATFEHLDNAPLADGAPVSRINAASTLTDLAPPAHCDHAPNLDDKTRYSFYNSDCTTGSQTCPANAQPPKDKGGKFKWSATRPYASAHLTDGKYGTQVVRCFDIYESAKTVSNRYREKLSGSPWANYQLVGVQWAVKQIDGPKQELTPFPAPIYLANTTLETYIQTNSVLGKGAGSCITCHNHATDTAGNLSNFSFLPHGAQ